MSSILSVCKANFCSLSRLYRFYSHWTDKQDLGQIFTNLANNGALVRSQCFNHLKAHINSAIWSTGIKRSLLKDGRVWKMGRTAGNSVSGSLLSSLFHFNSNIIYCSQLATHLCSIDKPF